MKILFVASECAPFVKTGGLADVIGALPRALAAAGVNVRVLIPAYPGLRALAGRATSVMTFDDLSGGRARIRILHTEGLELMLLDAPRHFDRAGTPYLGPDGKDWPDNDRRFAALSLAAAKLAMEGAGGWRPDIIHVHDWQTGLVPAYLAQSGRMTPPVVMTIHNIAFQGLFDASRLPELKLDHKLFTPEGFEYHGRIGFLKAGLALSDKITTVSPNYARELLTPDFGMGLEGLLRARQNDLTGIVNGIDDDLWNPETDPNLVRNYSARSLKRKVANKREIEARFGLQRSDGPLFCVISRLTSQKGIDVLLDCLPDLVGQGGRLALLGTGESHLEARCVAAAKLDPGRIGVIIGYDESLSHLLQGGSDAILIPSRFEPCGLTQLYGLRYGTLPIVSRTGGLADTVIDANEAALAAGCATGFQFTPVHPTALAPSIARACAIYRQADVWTAMVRRAMRHPVGWGRSARAYHRIYSNLPAA
ncbi:MAG: glycogen synthase GlgA [Rhodobacteraceae bacterium]|nr:glycogen synthase GlgA [Paracoccaceae bacterium]